MSAGTDASPQGLGIWGRGGGGGTCGLFLRSPPYLATPGLLPGRREGRTCSILLPVLLMEVGVKSELLGLVQRNLAPSLLCLTLAGVVFVYSVASAFLARFPRTLPFYILWMVVLWLQFDPERNW